MNEPPLDLDSAVQGVDFPFSLIAKSTVGMIKKFPPVVTNVPLQIGVGEHRLGADYTQGIQGHWGFTTTNMIPPRGTITRTDLGGGTADPYFSGSDSTGTIHNIGVRTTAGADNTFANHEGNVDFTMDDGYTGTAGYNSAVHKVKPLPMHGLTLNKTVTRKYGNRDKVFTFRLDMEQSWGRLSEN